MKNTRPCYGCEKRHPLCWRDCSDYAEYKTHQDAKRAALKTSEADVFTISVIEKNKGRKRHR